MGELCAYATSLLDYLETSATTDGVTLISAIKSATNDLISQTSSGLIITGVSANSSSTNFAFLKNISPGQVITILHALKKLYKIGELKLSDGLADGETPSDAEIQNWMELNIESIFISQEKFNYEDVEL